MTGIVHIVLARKPIEGTVAENCLQWGCGAISVDGCRIAFVTVGKGNLALNPHLRSHISGGSGGHIIRTETERRLVQPNLAGRWPANLILGGEEVIVLFPREAGALAPVRGSEASKASIGLITGKRERVAGAFHSDSGSASRFFFNFTEQESDE